MAETIFLYLNRRLVWNLNAETHAENQIQMCAVKEQIAKSKIINPSAHVQEVVIIQKRRFCCLVY